MMTKIMTWVWLSLMAVHADARWLSIEEAPSVILRLEMDIDVNKDGTYIQDVLYVTKVQSEDAKVNAGLMNIEYNSATDKVEVLEAFTKNGSKKIPVDPAAIEDRDKGEARDYDAIKVRTVVYPHVEIGSELHIRYRIQTHKPMLKDRWSTQLVFAPGIHVQKLRTRIRSERPLFVEVRDAKKLLNVKAKAKSVEVSNRKTLPGWVHAEKDPFFHPSGISEVWVSTEKSWAPFMADIEKDYDRIANAGIPVKLKPWLAEAAKKKTPEEKIHFILENMSQSFRYFGDWRRHDGGYTPRPISEIEASRYGDCKDLSVLLTALLRELRIEAHVALVRRGENPYGEEPDYKLPASNRFNHAIVRVKSGGHSYWLDPTNPVSSLLPYPDISGRPAYILSEKGGYFERLPAPKSDDFEHIHDYTYSFRASDEVFVKLKAAFNKLAPYRMANDLLLTSKSELLSSWLEYFSEDQEVRDFNFKKEPKTGRILGDMDVELHYTAGQVAYNAGKSMFWVIPDGGLEGAFYETEKRESDLRMAETPYTFVSLRRLKATGLAQEVPAPCRVQSTWMDMERKVRSEGGDVVIEQRMDLKKPYITREEFRSPAFRNLQKETKRCFHRSGILIQSGNGKFERS